MRLPPGEIVAIVLGSLLVLLCLTWWATTDVDPVVIECTDPAYVCTVTDGCTDPTDDIPCTVERVP